MLFPRTGVIVRQDKDHVTCGQVMCEDLRSVDPLVGCLLTGMKGAQWTAAESAVVSLREW